MTKTYKIDNSFFMYIRIPISYIGIGEVKYWFHCIAPKTAMYRLIVDEELDENYTDLKEREEQYPGTKVIAVVMNPWARIRLSYVNLVNNKDPRVNCEFNEFVKYISDNLENMSDKDKRSLRPQIDWLKYTDENSNVREADYIFKVETLDEEFKVIQDYFECQEPIRWFNELPEYREHYNEESKSLVAKMFAADIEKFEYKF
jgi:hypothetical protein